MRGEAKHGFERDVPVEAAIVPKDELVEVRVEMLWAQTVVGAQSPALHQREDAMDPWQGDMACHSAHDARIVPIIGKPRIRAVAVRQQSGSRFDVPE